MTDDERAQLLAMARSRRATQSQALRARIVLACAEGQVHREVATQLGVTPQTVGKWCARFVARRLEGLLDEPRSGAPRRIDEETVQRLIEQSLVGEATPAHPSSRALASQFGVSQSTVARVWRAAGLQPSSEAFRLSVDPRYVGAVRDVLGLYVSHSTRVLALSVDPRPAPAREPDASTPGRNAALLVPGAPRAAAADALWKSLDETLCGGAGNAGRPAAGSRRLLEFLRSLEASPPAQREVHVLIDDAARRERPALERWLGHQPRFTRHVAPTCGAWLVLLQRWIVVLKQRTADARAPASAVSDMEQALRGQFAATASRIPLPFVWVNPKLTL